MVLVGNVAVLAHRHQLKPHRGSNDGRANVFIAPGATVRGISGSDGAVVRTNRSRSNSEEEFRGFEAEEMPAKVGRRKRKADAANLPPASPVRRSKRLRNLNTSLENI